MFEVISKHCGTHWLETPYEAGLNQSRRLSLGQPRHDTMSVVFRYFPKARAGAASAVKDGELLRSLAEAWREEWLRRRRADLYVRMTADAPPVIRRGRD